MNFFFFWYKKAIQICVIFGTITCILFPSIQAIQSQTTARYALKINQRRHFIPRVEGGRGRNALLLLANAHAPRYGSLDWTRVTKPNKIELLKSRLLFFLFPPGRWSTTDSTDTLRHTTRRSALNQRANCNHSRRIRKSPPQPLYNLYMHVKLLFGIHIVWDH